MKYLKVILKVIAGLLLAVIVFLVAVILIDKQQTSYLDLKNNPDSKNNSYLLTNVNLVPMTQDTVLANQMVYVKDGIIQEIGNNLKTENVKTIDAGNGYLTPGLIDMHVHVWDKYELGLYLANGVTTVRNVWGIPLHLRMKKEINSGEILAPLFFTTGPKLTGPEFIGDDNLQLYTPEEAREKIIDYKERGYDYIKSYYGLPKDIFDAIIDQARISDMDIVAHPSQKVPYSYHFNPQIISLEHAEEIVQQPLNFELDTAKLTPIIREFKNSPHTSFTPTLIVFYNIYNMLIDDQVLSSELVQFMNPLIRKTDSEAQFERWSNSQKRDSTTTERIKKQHDFHLAIVRKLHEAGVNIICGTDAGIGITVPGYSLHQELALYQEAGMGAYEALKTATLNPSKTHKEFKNLGTIEKGKMANFVLTSGNPLENLEELENPQWVMVKGHKIEKDVLSEFIDKARNRNGYLATAIEYAENLIVEK
ncbi:MAG: amidohydrolase family protein [Cyclobacteriaceae bacterium]|nr:amidohydrolase family protein [Cyclobacteriaceae bacterium]